MNVFRHHIYEYKKGLRNLILHTTKAENRQDDICDLVNIFHECLGGTKYYARQPKAVKYICCGLKRSLILKKFRTVSQLREHIELMEW